MRKTLLRLFGGIVVLMVFLLALVGVLRFTIYTPIPDQPIIAYATESSKGSSGPNLYGVVMSRARSGAGFLGVNLVETSDGHFVCGADWSAYGSVPDLKTVLARRNSALAPCVLEEVVAAVRMQPKVGLYMTVKEGDATRASAFATALGDRLIVEAQTPEAVCSLKDTGVKHIIFSTAQNAWLFALASARRFPCFENIEAFAVPIGQALMGNALLAHTVTERPIYVYPVKSCLADNVVRFLGADAVFSAMTRPRSC